MLNSCPEVAKMKWLILGNAVLSLILAIAVVFTYNNLVEVNNRLAELEGQPAITQSLTGS